MEVKKQIGILQSLGYGKKTIAGNSAYQRTLLRVILMYHRIRIKGVPVDPALKIYILSFPIVVVNLAVKE